MAVNGNDGTVVHPNLPNIRLKAWKLCRNFLQGSWAVIEPEEMNIQEICGGLCNLMYHCSLPSRVKPKGNEPAEVLIRIFGKALLEHDQESSESYLTGLVLESVIFTLLSERKLGPKLMGVFNGGRLEEYIPARSLNSSDLRSKVFSDAIARKLAKFHRLSVPISKDPEWLFKTMSRWLAKMSKIRLEDISDHRERALAKTILAHDFDSEIEWMRKATESVNSPLVFCHNDLQGGNILVRNDVDFSKSIDDSIVVIDYEFCCYNFRGFDIANHLCEWTYDYNRSDNPFYTLKEENYPSKEKQLDFFRIYLQQYISDDPHVSGSAVPNCSRKKSLTLEQQVQALYKEVQIFTLASNLMWSLWSLSNTVDSKMVFGNWKYASDRLSQYFREKDRIMTELDLGSFKRQRED